VLDFDLAVRELESAVAVALGEQENGTGRLEATVVAFRAALEEYKHDQMPLDWAMTQNNLGNTLWRLGEREKRIWKRRPQPFARRSRNTGTIGCRFDGRQPRTTSATHSRQ
jgi:hypothetical protein